MTNKFVSPDGSRFISNREIFKVTTPPPPFQTALDYIPREATYGANPAASSLAMCGK
jgi:hypothetical protein